MRKCKYVRNDGSVAYVRHLDGLNEVVDIMRNSKENDRNSSLESSSCEIDSDSSWYGTSSMEEAMDLMRYGWEEGRLKLKKAIGKIAIDELVGKRCTVDQISDYTGDEVDIYRFLSGDPENMVEYHLEDSKYGKQANMLVNCSLSSSVSPERIIKRGAAIYSVIEALRAEGYALGLTMVESSKPERYSKKHKIYGIEYYIPIIEPGNYLDIDTASFCLAHPSFLRRAMFAVNETEKDKIRKVAGFYSGGGYGVPSKIFSKIPPNSFVINKGEGIDLKGASECQKFAQSIADRALKALGVEVCDNEKY